MDRSLSAIAFRLRAFDSSPAELETLHRWLNDTASWADSDTLNYTSPRYAEAFVLDSVTSIVDQGRLSLIVEAEQRLSPTETSKVCAGYVQLINYDPIGHKIEVGVYLDVAFRGLGYIRQIMPLVEGYIWQRLNCRMIYLSILASNTPAIKAFEGLGYTSTACLPEWKYVDGQYVDLYYYIKWNPNRSRRP